MKLAEYRLDVLYISEIQRIKINIAFQKPFYFSLMWTYMVSSSSEPSLKEPITIA